jgi:ABC-type lipoprotein export system ATPase subunit
VIEVNNLKFTYPARRRLEFGSFKVDHGSHSLILGQSGSGKTTLLHLLGGLLRGFDGTVAIKDIQFSTLSDTALDRFRGRNIGFIFQKLHLLPSLTVRQNLELAPWLSGNSSASHQPDDILTQLGMGDYQEAKITSLSHGQMQRVAIARAVMNKPALILADEPTSALDDKNCEDVINLLMTVAEESGSTLVIATHDQRLKSRIANTIHINA